tara:strand:+ start:72 stop:452 length:381 start_codon:yes stop_codon:yes gene_type:complete
MGVFSWKTQDTNESIPVEGNPGGRPHFSVTMTDNRGNYWIEHNYEGYGEFGGMDYYDLVAQMNPELTKHINEKANNQLSLRDVGIEIAFGDYADEAKFPNLTKDEHWDWVDNQPESCEYQGFFYDW